MPVLGRIDRRRLLTIGLAAALSAGPALAAGGLEYAVKANYLCKFAPFVEWPRSAFADAASPLVVCVLGEDPFGAALDQAARGQTVDGRSILVRRMAQVEPNAGCHVLFIGREPGRGLAETLKALAGEPILTVTDEPQPGAGAVIQFVVRQGHVRFDIDEATARANKLVISSKLLGLAVSRRRAG